MEWMRMAEDKSRRVVTTGRRDIDALAYAIVS